MGCFVLTNEEMVIKSNVPISDLKSLENENKNTFQKDLNANLVTVKQKIKSDEILDLLNQKEINKIQEKHRKSMKALKEISYKEVCYSVKYF